VQSYGGRSRGKGPFLSLGRLLLNIALVKTDVLIADKKSLQRSADLLLSGEIVAIPTETVYGLAAIGTQPQAVLKIFSAKGRPSTDPLILHLPSPDLNEAMDSGILSKSIPREAFKLALAFWPGPLTMILPRGSKVPDEVTSGLDTVAVRFPSHPVTQELLQLVKLPLAAPSANRFGRISPTDASSVMEELGGVIPLILDGGPCCTGLESTVLSFLPPEPSILRPGMITSEEIGKITGKSPPIHSQTITKKQSMVSPGMMESHYAPQTPLYLSEHAISKSQSGIEFIHYHSPNILLESNHHILAVNAKPETAARNLYRYLRLADSRKAKAIVVEPIPESPWAIAIRDRLQRASVGTARYVNDRWVLTPKTRH